MQLKLSTKKMLALHVLSSFGDRYIHHIPYYKCDYFKIQCKSFKRKTEGASVAVPCSGAPAVESQGVGATSSSLLPRSGSCGWAGCSSSGLLASSSSMRLSSSQTHSSQQWPGSLARRGLEQCQPGRGTACGQRGMQPTTPSMQLHWCSQLGWKSSPCW